MNVILMHSAMHNLNRVEPKSDGWKKKIEKAIKKWNIVPYYEKLKKVLNRIIEILFRIYLRLEKIQKVI
jgi:hypothetical protein